MEKNHHWRNARVRKYPGNHQNKRNAVLSNVAQNNTAVSAAKSATSRTMPMMARQMSHLNATPHWVQCRVDHRYAIDSRLTGLLQLGHLLLPGL